MTIKICECGCGMETKMATTTNKKREIIKGQPLRFIAGHSANRKYVPPTKICQNCNKEFSRISPKGNRRSIQHRKYCWECSPPAEQWSGNRKTLELSKKTEFPCFQCKLILPASNFFIRSDNRRMTSRCRSCTVIYNRIKRSQQKIIAVESLGGKCIICDYDKCIDALDFHHPDPSKKEYNLALLFNHGVKSKIKAEIAKCILICSNCHREIHAGLHPEYLLSEVNHRGKAA